MSAKTDALKTLSNIDRLSRAYSAAKGHPMMECTITRAQFAAIESALKNEKIPPSGIDLTAKTYGGIKLNIQ